MSRGSTTAALTATVLFATGCWEQVHPKWFSQMKEQPAVQHLEGQAPFAPPDHTIPAGGITPRLAPDNPMMAAGAPMHAPEARAVVNPIAADAESLARGKKMYDVHCGLCHAPDGMASPALAPLAAKLAEAGAPPFPLSTTVAYTDGQLYTKIRYGKPLMPAYPQIVEEDRWHIVNYLRSMFPTGG